MITLNSPIVGPATGTLREVRDYLGWDWSVDQRDYLTELWRLCEVVGFNAAILAAQSAHETANWSSRWWLERRNPAGIGITGDPAQNKASHTWANGTEAARAHVAHMYAYTGKAKPTPPGQLWHGDNGWAQAQLGLDLPLNLYDPRWTDVVAAGFWGTVRVLGDLGNGKWATDPHYAEQIAAKANQIFKEEPMPNLVIGKAERPSIRDDIVDKPQGMGWDDYGPRTLRALVLHRVVGAARYTSGHFRNLDDPHGRNALTDWGVCGALDGDWDGVILKWNDPDSRRSPWASGPLFDASGNLLANGDAVGFYRRYVLGDPAGANVINRDTEAIEFSGLYDTPLTRKQLASGVALIAYRIDVKMRLPWSTWPKNHEGEQAILWHGEIMGWQKPCAGAVVIASTDTIINLVGERLKTIQERAEPTPIPEPPVVVPPKAYRPSHARLAQWFGQATVDGRVIAYERDDPIATIWRQRGKATGLYPAVDPTGSDLLNDGTLIVRFEDGWVVADPKGAAPPRPLERTG